MNKGIVTLGLSLMMAGALVCGANSYNDEANAENTVEQTADDVKQTIDDAAITAAIKAKFGADDLVSASSIDIDTDNGFVTLNGVVKTKAEADRAVEIAQTVDGVRQVSSNLKLNSASEAESTNSEIKERTGEAASDVKESAEKAGTSITEGVEKTADAVSDATITGEIKLKFASDDLVSASSIDIDTKNGIVHLNGKVKNQAEANRAVEIAKKVDGVKKVRSNLVILPS